jgi:hypothetical protein
MVRGLYLYWDNLQRYQEKWRIAIGRFWGSHSSDYEVMPSGIWCSVVREKSADGKQETTMLAACLAYCSTPKIGDMLIWNVGLLSPDYTAL